MTRRRDPFATALEDLRSRAESGLFAPGRSVVIIDEAHRLKLSTTPVREALSWLCGYGLIERAPAGGYLAPRMDTATVRDRFTFRLLCLSTSLNGASQAQCATQNEPDPSVQGLSGHLFRAVRGTGNATLIDAYVRVNSQLAQLAGAERRLFGDLDVEAARIIDLFGRAAGSGLREALTAYHQRRIDAAPLLVVEAEAGRDLSYGQPE